MSPGPPPWEGVIGQYRHRPSKVQVGLPAAVVVLAVLITAINIADENWWRAALWTVVAVSSLLQVRAEHRVRTVVDADGVRVHTGWVRPRVVPWHEITAISLPGRWDRYSWLHRRNGREVKLLGMPTEAAQQLDASLHRARGE